MKKNWFLLLLPLLIGCEKENSPKGCTGEEICTRQFEVLLLELEENGEPLVLKEYEVVNLDNNNIYSYFNDIILIEAGTYIAITDSEFNEINKTGTTLLLKGKREDDSLFEIEYEVGHDCCHVIPISGPFKEN